MEHRTHRLKQFGFLPKDTQLTTARWAKGSIWWLDSQLRDGAANLIYASDLVCATLSGFLREPLVKAVTLFKGGTAQTMPGRSVV